MSNKSPSAPHQSRTPSSAYEDLGAIFAAGPESEPQSGFGEPREGAEGTAKARDPNVLEVVVIGPVGAGKTTLIKSLRHPADTAHSFADRYSVEALDAAAHGGRAAETGAAKEGPAERPKQNRSVLARLVGRKSGPPPLPSVPKSPERSFAEATRRGPADAAATYARQLRDDVAEGLRGDATAAALTPIPFTLVIRAHDAAEKRRGRSTIEFAVTAVDTKGGVFAEAPEDKPKELRGAFEEEQRAALERLAAADAALICLPADEPELDPSRRRSMQTVLARLAHAWAQAAAADRSRRFRVVVALTKFERMFLGAGRRAFLAANARESAGRAVADSLSQTWGWLSPRLRELAAAPHVELLVQPVSAFGFIPGDGGANFDPSTGLLRTRPFADPAAEHPDAPIAPTLDAPYTFEAVFAHYWRPFLVLDPFIQLATGDPGALSFALEGGDAGRRS